MAEKVASLETRVRRFPAISFTTLWHLGTLDPQEKGCHGESQEGHGLSVSTEPDAWERIAKLGGSPLWELEREGNRFLDVHAMDDSLRQEIADWNERRGNVTWADAWEWTRYDEELDTQISGLSESLEDAALEAGFDDFAEEVAACEAEGREPPELSAEVAERVTQKRVLVPTEALCERLKVSGASKPSVLIDDWMAIAYAEDVLMLDGVWWEDRLDLNDLSAPRGVIFPDRLFDWGAVCLSHPKPR